MKEPETWSRREFLSALAVGGVLSLAVDLAGCGAGGQAMIRHAQSTGEFVPNMYVTVKHDGRIGVEVDKTEFGQGITTAYCTLIAEDLDVDMACVDFHFAASQPQYRTYLNMQATGGSASTSDRYLPLRTAAAAAREMLVSAAAVQWGVAATQCETRAGFVIDKLSGRTLGYGALTLQAARQPVPQSPWLKPNTQFRVIGKHNQRVDVRAKVDGSARFGVDVTLPNMVRAYVLHGPVFGAQALHVAADEARKLPGVIDVFAFPGGVAVVAEKYWQARAAARVVDIQWTAGDVAGLDTDELRNAVHGYRLDDAELEADKAAAATFAHAALQLEAVYDGPFLAAAALEPQNCTVHVTATGAEVWAPCQSPSIVQSFVAHALGIAADAVLVHTTFVGGAFGRRTLADFAAQAASIAKHLQRPVQMLWTRESDMTQGFYRPQQCARVRGGVTERGEVAGVSARVLGQSLLISSLPSLRAVLNGVPEALQTIAMAGIRGMIASNTVSDIFSTEGITDTSYVIPHLHAAWTPVSTKLPVASWRSVGHSFNGFVMESFVDELAHAAGVDPLVFRRRMLPNDSRARRVLDAVAELARWGAPVAPGIGRGIARHCCYGTDVAEVADIELVNGQILVRRVYAAVDCGLIVNPDIVRSQVEGAIIFGLSAALHQQITLVDGVVQQTNFDTYPALRMHECPEIIVKMLDSDAAPSGIGEPGLPPIAPAVANALFQLTGVRLRRLPLQPSWSEQSR